MTDIKGARLSKLAKELNVGIHTIVDYLKKKGHVVENNPNTKVSQDLVNLLEKEFSGEVSAKKESEKVNLKTFREKKETITVNDIERAPTEEEEDTQSDMLDARMRALHIESDRAKKDFDIKVVGKIDLSPQKIIKPEPPQPTKPETAKTQKPQPEVIPKPQPQPQVIAPKPEAHVHAPKITEPKQVEVTDDAADQIKVVGKIDLDAMNLRTRPPKKSGKERDAERRVAEKEIMRRKAEDNLKKQNASRIPDNSSINETSDFSEDIVMPEISNIADDEVNVDIPKDDFHRIKIQKLSGPTVVGRIDLPVATDRRKPVASSSDFDERNRKKKRKRIPSDGAKPNEGGNQNQNNHQRQPHQGQGQAGQGQHRPNQGQGQGQRPQGQGGQQRPQGQGGQQRPQGQGGQQRPQGQGGQQRPQGQGAPQRPQTGAATTGSQGSGAVLKKKEKKKVFRPEVNEVDVQKQIKETLARLTDKSKSKTSKYRRDKRDAYSMRQAEEMEAQELDKNVLKVTEWVTVNELATMMEVPATKVIGSCMSLGLFVSINQRLDAETIVLVAEEFKFKVEFVSVEIAEAIADEVDSDELLKPRSPIVTVMGHVDHGKTKLLDFIRSANVIAGEAGGITQHIGAYSVVLDDGRTITFLDTPGHEAFTAMRARGAKVTDVVIIVVAADDGIMPQTREAINHAQAAGVPIVFAINKIDKPTANPEKIKEELANMNMLVEDWGGKFQSQEVSAKTGQGINLLLEKVLLEAEMLDLKANPDRRAKGTVIESTLDKGRGYVATILVHTGTLKVGDTVLAGSQFGRVKAMYNERNKKVDIVGPATPVLILGLDGAPQAGDEFHVMADEKEARDIANKREQLQREQGMRTKKHITLDEIGRRIAIGNFKELNVIVKGDVDGSVEALSDSLVKLSTQEIQVNIIHKAVGAISESDVLLAAASNAVIIGFQVRPSLSARKLAEKEQIDIRLYSIIYDAIEELKDAMEGMLSPEIKEEVVATLEVMEVFNITKVGNIAGCMCREGKIQRNVKVRLIRDGIVVHSGELASLKRFKDDVKEVVSGQDCGLNIQNFNDIRVGDTIEGFKETEVKKKL